MKNILKLLCFLPLTVLGQVSQNENYVHVTTYQESVSETTATTAPEDAKIESVTYYDGLGRVKQTTQLRAGGNKEDIIIPVARDAFGRTTRSYLPYAVGGNNGTYRNNALEELNGFYNTQKYEYTTNPYSETITEISPLNRAEETAAPGNPWAYNAANTQYENPVYVSYPTTTEYGVYWRSKDIFHVPTDDGGLPHDGDDEDPFIIGKNFLNIKIEDGSLRLRTHMDTRTGYQVLATGRLRHLDVYPLIKELDLGAITDPSGNPTDYSMRIEDNYFTIYTTTETPALITEGIEMDATYDLTELQILTSYTDTYTTNHTTKADYGLNIADEVARFDVVITDGIPALVSNGYYPAGELTKVISKDENWTAEDNQNRTTEGFTNKSGQTLLQRSYNTGVAHDTYSVYDNFGNLTFVIPPKVTIGNGVSDIELSELCYQYRYDERNRLVEKKIPGKGWEYIVYNNLDQPVLTQDAIQRPKKEWMFTKYDVFGRVVYTGLHTHPTAASRVNMQNYIRDTDNYTQFETKRETPINISGTALYYTNNAVPSGGYQIYTINYYDDYTFDRDGMNKPASVYGVTTTNTTKGLATGSKVRVLGTNQWTTSVIAYDERGRSIWAGSRNRYLNTIDKTETQLDFVGKPIQVKSTHTKDSNAAIVTIDAFTYDHMGRVLTQKQRINNQTEELIAQHVYDDIGQLETKKVGNAEQAPLQTVDYKYNVRGWLTDINDVNTIGDDLFSFKINYDTVEGRYNIPSLYNGNISQTIWKTANDNTKRSYAYQYDALNRIKNSQFRYNENLTAASLRSYDLNIPGYDKNGNIIRLTRYDDQGTNNIMDNLVYTYNENGIGNKLLKVNDSGNDLQGFKDGTNTNDDYEYDVNGNMTIDRNKGIDNIQYNHLNLPTSIRSTLYHGFLKYVYDANGTKLSKEVSRRSGTDYTYYNGNYIYEKNGRNSTKLKFINTPEGYIEPETNGTFSYIYQHKDHLGNIRLSYSDKDNDGKIDVLRNNTDIDSDGDNAHEILAENNYYPFGLQHKGYNNTITAREHPYKYNGQELNQSLGYNMTELTFRHYDNALGRFVVPDPLAELAPGITPFRYGFNNPVVFNDPLGLYENTSIARNGGDIVIDWGSGNSGGGAIWFNNGTNNGAGHDYNFTHEEALMMFEPADWELVGANFSTDKSQRMALEPVGLSFRKYGKTIGDAIATDATSRSLLRQVGNNIRFGSVQDGFRQGQWIGASGMTGHNGWRHVPVVGGLVNSYDWFARGDMSRGMFYAAMGISDAFGAKSLVTGAGKLIARQAWKQSFKKSARALDDFVANSLSKQQMSSVYGAGDDVAKTIPELLQYNSVESLVGNAGKLQRLKGGIKQGVVNGNIDDIFNGLVKQYGSKRQTIGRETFFKSGNIRIGIHNSAKGGGASTIHINNAGQLFKIRVNPW